MEFLQLTCDIQESAAYATVSARQSRHMSNFGSHLAKALELRK